MSFVSSFYLFSLIYSFFFASSDFYVDSCSFRFIFVDISDFTQILEWNEISW